MSNITKRPLHKLGYDFIDERFIPKGQDEYYLRDEFLDKNTQYRSLKAYEIEVLVKNDNASDNWNAISVTDKFDPNLVKGCKFFGKVRIGALEPFLLEYSDIQLQVGLYNSTIVSCDLGDNVVVNNVTHLAHYIIGNETILQNIDELTATNRAKFGNGIVKEGEDEGIRIWLELCNENTGRKVLPFDGMLASDAFIWSKYRDDQALMDKFTELTEKMFDKKRGHYGYIGQRNIIKNCKIIKDVKIGDDAYVKGANKLKNLTIRSSREAKTQIGEGVEMVNGIIGFGCRAFYGVKAVRFIMGAHSGLKYGARLINSFLGNNSTISCCEVLNTLIYPSHEQHHNNSFLCAALVMGQSNIAAGATIGSNHNSRGADGEIVAGRGFWPGLCISLKHNSKFASFTLISKGDYPSEINLPLPFSLILNDETGGRLKIMPAYWFQYNMYALARNSWKYKQRDKRHLKINKLEFDYLAPDTIQEIVESISLLEKWTATSFLQQTNPEKLEKIKAEDLLALGKELLLQRSDELKEITVFADKIENSRREVEVIKPANAYKWYCDLIAYYAAKNLVKFIESQTVASFSDLKEKLKYRQKESWVNVGGQLVREEDLTRLKEEVKDGVVDSWRKIHTLYETLGHQYEEDKLFDAYSTFLRFKEITPDQFSEKHMEELLYSSVEMSNRMSELVYVSRRKDYENEFRLMTYENTEERDAVVGKLEDNDFIKVEAARAKSYETSCNELIKKFL